MFSAKKSKKTRLYYSNIGNSFIISINNATFIAVIARDEAMLRRLSFEFSSSLARIQGLFSKETRRKDVIWTL